MQHKCNSARLTNQNNKDMERYDYRQAVCEDIRTYIEDNDIKVTSENKEELQEELNDTLWVEDSVTGNASGSYTFNAWKAEEYVCHNLDLLGEALEEFGCSPDYMAKNGAEACDVTIRCYLLGQCLDSVLSDLAEESEETEE